jgi:hypothetical protein
MNPWLAPEISILEREYPTRGGKGCAALLPGRTVDAISQKAMLLGLRIRAPSWTVDELATLDREYARVGPSGMRELLPGRTYHAIAQRASLRGLEFKPGMGPPRKSYPVKAAPRERAPREVVEPVVDATRALRWQL